MTVLAKAEATSDAIWHAFLHLPVLGLTGRAYRAIAAKALLAQAGFTPAELEVVEAMALVALGRAA